MHEMVHLCNLQNGIIDVSRGGRYHNKKFKEKAEESGLIVEHHQTYGWTKTELAQETENFINSLVLNSEDFSLSRESQQKLAVPSLNNHIGGMFARIAD